MCLIIIERDFGCVRHERWRPIACRATKSLPWDALRSRQHKQRLYVIERIEDCEKCITDPPPLPSWDEDWNMTDEEIECISDSDDSDWTASDEEVILGKAQVVPFSSRVRRAKMPQSPNQTTSPAAFANTHKGKGKQTEGEGGVASVEVGHSTYNDYKSGIPNYNTIEQDATAVISRRGLTIGLRIIAATNNNPRPIPGWSERPKLLCVGKALKARSNGLDKKGSDEGTGQSESAVACIHK